MNPLRQIHSRMSIMLLNVARSRGPGLRTILLLLCFAIALTVTTRIVFATDTGSQGLSAANALQTTSGQAPEPEEHGISQKAIEVARLGKFPITNSMILSWVVALGLILFAQLATRDMQQVPSGAQNFLEWIVEGLYKFLEGIIGAHLVDRTFWFLATIFYLHSFRQLDGVHSRDRLDWVGASDLQWLQDRSASASRLG